MILWNHDFSPLGNYDQTDIVEAELISQDDLVFAILLNLIECELITKKMKNENFPFIASALGLFLMLLVIKGSELRDDGITLIPLLTLLVVSEFAFFVNAIGAYIGIKHTLATGIRPFGSDPFPHR